MLLLEPNFRHTVAHMQAVYNSEQTTITGVHGHRRRRRRRRRHHHYIIRYFDVVVGVHSDGDLPENSGLLTVFAT